MKKRIIAGLLAVFAIATLICGCSEQKSVTYNMEGYAIGTLPWGATVEEVKAHENITKENFQSNAVLDGYPNLTESKVNAMYMFNEKWGLCGLNFAFKDDFDTIVKNLNAFYGEGKEEALDDGKKQMVWDTDTVYAVLVENKPGSLGLSVQWPETLEIQ